MCIAEVIAGAAHEGIPKPTEIGAVTHLFGEYVGNVELSAIMLEHNSTIGNPFASCLLTIFDMAISFGGHSVTPFDACIIVIVENSGIGCVIDRIPQGGEKGYHVVGIDRQTQAYIC